MIKEMKALKKFDLNNIDKSKWESFPFEKIAFRIAETVNPNTTDLETYYGLEHLDAESLHIRRNGVPSDVSGGKLKCYPGDIIFGKRRAYQRKAGIVKEAGICSAHSFVFRANEGIIDARLFPFFLHSDQFMHKMIDISVGGLSPTINWTDLKHEEFLLPPKEQQEELADLLWAMDEVIEKDFVTVERIAKLLKSSFKEIFVSEKILKLKELCDITSGDTAPQDSKNFIDGFYPFIRMQHINQNKLGYSNKFDFINDLSISKMKMYPKNSILIPKSGESIRSENKIILDRDSYVVNHLAVLYNFNNDANFKYVFYFLNNFKLSSLINQTSMPSLNLSDIGNIKVPFKNISQQNEIVAKLDEIVVIKENTSLKLQSSKALQKSLINQIF